MYWQSNSFNSISVGEDSVVEYCIIENGAKIGKNCIVSNLHVPANSCIPDGCYLHSIPVKLNYTTYFATFAFGIVLYLCIHSLKRSVLCRYH